MMKGFRPLRRSGPTLWFDPLRRKKEQKAQKTSPQYFHRRRFKVHYDSPGVNRAVIALIRATTDSPARLIASPAVSGGVGETAIVMTSSTSIA